MISGEKNNPWSAQGTKQEIDKKETSETVAKEKPSEKLADQLEDDILDFSDMSIDDIIINLQIISSLDSGDKLCINDNSLEIDQSYFFIKALKRWYGNNNRIKTVTYIEKIIQRTFDIIDTVYNDEMYKSMPVKTMNLLESQDIDKNGKQRPFKLENSRLLLKLSNELTDVIIGLESLKTTYIEDSRIKSKIKLIIDKVSVRIEKINERIKITF